MQNDRKGHSRRQALKVGAGLGVCAVASVSAWADDNPSRKFTVDLCPGRIGVKANQMQAIEMAVKHKFESVEPLAWDLAEKSEKQCKAIVESLDSNSLTWGAAGLPVDFRNDEDKFQAELKKLPKACEAMARCGVKRVGTWIMPAHNQLTYRQNFELHAKRLQKCASVLAKHELGLGLEYVGPKTLWSSMQYSFVHTMAETKELIAAIGENNVGFVLDSWHWYTAKETVADLLSISAKQIYAVDLNDAPTGLEIDQQIDQTRTLPAATGVIDVKSFLNALIKLGYDGPVRAEPFDKSLNALDNEPALAKTSQAMWKAMNLVGG